MSSFDQASFSQRFTQAWRAGTIEKLSPVVPDRVLAAKEVQQYSSKYGDLSVPLDPIDFDIGPWISSYFEWPRMNRFFYRRFAGVWIDAPAGSMARACCDAIEPATEAIIGVTTTHLVIGEGLSEPRLYYSIPLSQIRAFLRDPHGLCQRGRILIAFNDGSYLRLRGSYFLTSGVRHLVKTVAEVAPRPDFQRPAH